MVLRLNMSDEEASSQARSYTVLPSGDYVCNIVNIKPEQVRPESDNAGKDYWNIQFVVDEGEYAGRSIYANVMLFEGALFAIRQLAGAVFPEDVDLASNKLEVRNPGDYEGKKVIVTGIKYNAGSSIKRRGKIAGKRDRDVFEVKGYRSVDQVNKSTDKPSLLP